MPRHGCPFLGFVGLFLSGLSSLLSPPSCLLGGEGPLLSLRRFLFLGSELVAVSDEGFDELVDLTSMLQKKALVQIATT